MCYDGVELEKNVVSLVLAGLRGSLAEQVAALVASRTGWRIEGRTPGSAATGEQEGIIYLGWGASPAGTGGVDPLLARDTRPGPVLRVLLTAPWGTRVRRIAAEAGVGELLAAGMAATEESQQDPAARLSGWAVAEAPARFDLVINTERLSAQAAADLIVAAIAAVRLETGAVPPSAAGTAAAYPAPASVAAAPAPLPAAVQPPTVTLDASGAPQPIHHPPEPGVRPNFAHPSEEEFARMLDFYRVAWQYEPTTFPLEWDEQGRVTSAFTPDFYLPEWNLYVELTTMKQSLVTRKNRKARRLKELYPRVNIKVLYGRDFERLAAKFGRGAAQAAGRG